MDLTIDDIYELFSWETADSDEEWAVRVETGIAEARKLKNIFPFIQPTVAGRNNKSVWEPCAKVIVLKSDEDLEDYLYELLEWLQDMNWPGADIIFNRLSQISADIIQSYIDFSIFRAKRAGDECWLNVLEALREHRDWC